ncbi:MAG: polyamine aminopropyltransferase [Elusimicrobiota bacterium]
MPKKKFWLTERFTRNEKHSHRIEKYLVTAKSRFQKIILAKTCSFGRCLILDGEMQSAELDEFIYHEALIHPPLIMHRNPQTVLIMGGGEGAALREILKHRSIKKVVLVDIDGEVINFCEKYLKKWHQGRFSDPRLELIIDDAKKYMENTSQKFDVIISDLPSPVEAGPAYNLYTVEFYKTLRQRLSPGGIINLQAGSGSLLQIEFHSALFHTLSTLFPVVQAYYVYVPSFDVPWAFLFVSQDEALKPLTVSEKEIDQRMEKRIGEKLNFYDGYTHHGLFRIPRYLRKILQEEKKMITQKKPLFFYK